MRYTILSSLLLAAQLVQSQPYEIPPPRPFPVYQPTAIPTPAPVKIQAAILLDVSNSMDGLIEQAKAQLWNMVSIMGRAQCGTGAPQFEIALYEYGRTNNDPAQGYVKQISPFTTNLDRLSSLLFALNTYGGEEYCGQAIYTSLNELTWDNNPNSYKVIFIAGNESFQQGGVHFTKSCTLAKNKSVIVNTIYCGDRTQGIREHWNLGAECGTGSFTFINSNERVEEFSTPYDTMLFSLNDRLNNTYLAFGSEGRTRMAEQASADQKNYAMNKSVMAKRVMVKGNKAMYKNEDWDLVEAAETKPELIAALPADKLPESMKGKTRAEIAQEVKKRAAERKTIQAKIDEVGKQREAWIVTEKKRIATSRKNPTSANTLETAVENIIREQAGRYRMVIQ
jgi:hypothetical protein